MRRIQLDRRLLWLAPVLAAAVALGPATSPAAGSTASSTHSSAAGRASAADLTDADDATAPGPAAETPTAPRLRLTGGAARGDAVTAGLPSTTELATALVAVLGLGAAGIWLLARARPATATTGDGPVRLRQSLRLTPKSWLHAVEFDGRLVLVGDGERGPVLLLGAEPVAAPEEEGVELRDTQLPRPTPIPRPTPETVALGGFDELLRRAARPGGVAR